MSPLAAWLGLLSAAVLLLVMLSINMTVLRKVDDAVGGRELDLGTLRDLQTVLGKCQALHSAFHARPPPAARSTVAARATKPAISGGWLSGMSSLVQAAVGPNPEEQVKRLQTMLDVQRRDTEGVTEQHAAVRKQMAELERDYQMLLKETKHLREQLTVCDVQIANLTHVQVPEPHPVPPLPANITGVLAEWIAKSGLAPDIPLRSAGRYFTAANWQALQTLVVLVATGRVNHNKRALYHVHSWMKLMPNSSKLFFISDGEDPLLNPAGVIALPNNEPGRNGFQAAQRRFIRGLARAAEMFANDSSVRWVYLMDDDAFLYPPNMALLVPKLDPKKPHFYGEMCGGLPGVVFPCGGGGLFISLYSLRKSLRALDSCYLAKEGPMGQYDVAISHCFANVNITAHPRAEFCSQPPGWYMPTGKGPYFAEQFKDYVSFHYITQEMDLLYTKTLYNVPWWPTTHQLPAGVTPSIPGLPEAALRARGLPASQASAQQQSDKQSQQILALYAEQQLQEKRRAASLRATGTVEDAPRPVAAAVVPPVPTLPALQFKP